MKITISTTEYNEVNPTELLKLFEKGATLVKSKYANGVYIGTYEQNNGNKIEKVKAYSDDDILVNNIKLPLSINATYTQTIEINI